MKNLAKYKRIKIVKKPYFYMYKNEDEAVTVRR